MKDLLNVVLTMIFIGVFISFFSPVLIILLVVLAIFWVIRLFRGPRRSPFQDGTYNREEPIEDQTTYYETRGKINPDVIEAEYTETEEK